MYLNMKLMVLSMTISLPPGVSVVGRWNDVVILLLLGYLFLFFYRMFSNNLSSLLKNK